VFESERIRDLNAQVVEYWVHVCPYGFGT
jgi:hypothetical protein